MTAWFETVYEHDRAVSCEGAAILLSTSFSVKGAERVVRLYRKDFEEK